MQQPPDVRSSNRGDETSTVSSTSCETEQEASLLRQLATLFAEQNNRLDGEDPWVVLADDDRPTFMRNEDAPGSGLRMIDLGRVLGPLDAAVKERIAARLQELVPSAQPDDDRRHHRPLPSTLVTKGQAPTGDDEVRGRVIARGQVQWWAIGVGFIAAAAAVALAMVPHPPVDAGRFAARGGITSDAPESEARSRVFVFEIRPGEAPQLAGNSLHAGSELAFSYENRSGKQRLAVFGVNEHRDVYWFYPAWTDPSADPVAISIETDEHRHELREAIRQDLEGAQLELHALFLDEALSVRQIEAMVRERGVADDVEIPGAVDNHRPFVLLP